MIRRVLPILAVLVLKANVAAEIRLGLIGCDTSHVTGFTEAFNNVAGKNHVPGGKVVAAYKGGSPDLPESWSRVEDYSTTLREKYGVKFYDSIEELCRNVDAVLLTSVDGRKHLEQLKPVIAAHKPVFIDKPIAASLADAVEIFQLAREAKVPIWSSSSLRYGGGTQAAQRGSVGLVQSAETFSPCIPVEFHPELFWYGIHGIEALYTVMGTGCESVQRRVMTNGGIEVVGIWNGGRTGVYRQDLAKKYGGIARGERGEVQIGSHEGYTSLLKEIIKFYHTGKPPVTAEETIELVTFMTAAELSKERNGAIVKLSELLPDSPTGVNYLSEAELQAGWRLLWDGKTTNGWRGTRNSPHSPSGWIMKNGILSVPATGGGESSAVGDIMTIERFANFEFEADVRYSKGSNSGIKYFVQPDLDPVSSNGARVQVGSAIGLEFQIVDDRHHPEGANSAHGNHGLGALYDLFPAHADKHVNSVGEWNHIRIISNKRHVQHWLNGKLILEFKREGAAFRNQVLLSKFKTISGFGEWSDGHILLQDHGDEAAFRNIKIRALSGSD
jgi:hypothetical protein